MHHVAKDAGTTPRGHGCLNADADSVLIVEGEGANTRSIRLGKNRNGASDARFAFNIAAETLGEDEDGDPITTPIAEEADARTARTVTRVAALAGAQRTALEALRTALIENGQPGPSSSHIPAGARVVQADAWRSRFYAATISDGADDSKRRAFKRAAEALQGRGIIAGHNNLVWLATVPDIRT